MESMTGYGTATLSGEGAEISVQVKSVNSRYLDLIVKSPGLPPRLESSIRERIRSAVARGRVEFYLDVRWSGVVDPSVNESTIRRWKDLLDKVHQNLGFPDPVHLRDIIRLPGVIEATVGGETLWERIREPVLETVDRALGALKAMRAAEGENLRAVLEERAALMRAALDRIAAFREEARARSLERMRTRIREILTDSRLDEDRLLQEAAWWANRTEIAEEIDRFRSHLSQFLQALGDGSGVGKRLDFIVQEMNREINTILSKAEMTEISREGITVKAELEKIREQVQNID
ncbi:MAG: YicC family protein [Acidobacteria bacterium]|nr:YicC family protein [Acidobacteriota bacterium]